MNDKKLAYQSKTLWVNLILAVCAFFPNVQEYISAHPELFTTVFAVLNIILRVVSKSGLQIL